MAAVARRWRMLALSILALAATAAGSAAEDGDALPDPAPGQQRLLARIKAQHPDWSILKCELRTGDLEGEERRYVVKMMSPDGRVFRQSFDASTLALVAGPRDDGGSHRRRERHRGGR